MAAPARYGVFDAFSILLREGLEALLVIAALLAFLSRTGNDDKRGWIWGGSLLGVAASVGAGLIIAVIFRGVVTGSNRELIEGISGLIAAAMLFAVAFTIVITAFGVPRSSLVILAAPAAVLTGLAFSAPLIAYAATLKGNANNFNAVFRFIITPLFLFSGVFFPLTRLPPALRAAAWLTPLFHGVELTRGLTLGTIESPSWYLHVGYLAGMTAAGVAAAIWTFERALRT